MSAEQPCLPLGPPDLGAHNRRGVESIQARSILTAASGFMRDYDYTLNPYAGCTFGCHYCYAAFFSRDQELQRTWGEWVKVKENAVALLRRRRTNLRGKRIYMSSVTDPYQPIERDLQLSRALLSELLHDQPHLVMQTRGPLVVRDIDLFQRFENVRINVTITTDSEDVRKAFEPRCPSNARRLRAIAELVGAGLEVHVTLTPLLPVEDATAFARTLLATGAEHFVVQPFHSDRGRFTAGTRDQALHVAERLAWDEQAYRRVVTVLRDALPSLTEGREGFAP